MPATEKSSKPAPASKPKLVDEPDEEPAQPEPEPEPEPEHQSEGEEYDVKRAIQMSLESFHAEGHAYVGGVAIREPVAEATRPLPRQTLATKEASSGPSAQPQDDTSANVVRDSPSPADAETGAESDKTNSGEQIFMPIDQARPDPGESRVALAGPDPEPTHDEILG
ncbi:hypothetical protein Tco_1397174 [Tanacetum coccineum]